MIDNVNDPAHYQFSNDAQVIDITENLNFNRGNAVKYVARAGRKDPDTELEDLLKAQYYLDREILRIEELQQGETRKWSNARNIPAGVAVFDREGDWWGPDDIRDELLGTEDALLSDLFINRWGPFTEAIGDGRNE